MVDFPKNSLSVISPFSDVPMEVQRREKMTHICRKPGQRTAWRASSSPPRRPIFKIRDGESWLHPPQAELVDHSMRT